MKSVKTTHRNNQSVSLNTEPKQHALVVAADLMPDGNGGWQPVPPIFTREDVIRYARLDTFNIKDPNNTIDYYIEKGHLKPTKISTGYVFHKQDVDEFLNKLHDLTIERSEK